jgi:hypothetical protein
MNALVLALALASADPKAEPTGTPSVKELDDTVSGLKNKPQLKKFFADAHGFAVFPRVGRGALGVGGAFGEGGVYKGGKLVARTTLTQVTIGLGAGGEQYTEIIFFKDKAAFSQFEQGNVKMDAHATAVAAEAAVGESLPYNNGVAIFTFTKGGLMADASIGGQRFTFDKLKK